MHCFHTLLMFSSSFMLRSSFCRTSSGDNTHSRRASWQRRSCTCAYTAFLMHLMHGVLRQARALEM